MARILLAEDDEAVRRFVRRALELDGHEIVETFDGTMALDILVASREPFDLLLSDITMPELDGIALAHAAHAARPHLPIVLMTGYAERREVAAGLASVVRVVVAKPFSLVELRRQVGRVLASSSRVAA
jgi:two-component system cell cycle response regulator CpdR